MELTKYTHACLLLAKGTTKVLFDPGVFSKEAIDFEGINAMVITHEHTDHFDVAKVATILQQSPTALIYTNSSVAAGLTQFNEAVKIVKSGETVQVGEFRLNVVGGEHARIFSNVDPIQNIGVIVNGLLYVPGDSYFVPNEKPAWLALPLNAPWAKLEETLQFAAAMQPQHIFAVHDGLLSEAGRQVYGGGRGLPETAIFHDLRPGDKISLA